MATGIVPYIPDERYDPSFVRPAEKYTTGITKDPLNHYNHLGRVLTDIDISVAGPGNIPSAGLFASRVVFTAAATGAWALPTAVSLLTEIQSTVFGSLFPKRYAELGQSFEVVTTFRNDTAAAVTIGPNTGLNVVPNPITVPAGSSIRVVFEVLGSTYDTAAFNVYVEDSGSGANAPNVTLTSAGTGTSLVYDGIGPVLQNKSLDIVGDGLSLTDDGNGTLSLSAVGNLLECATLNPTAIPSGTWYYATYGAYSVTPAVGGPWSLTAGTAAPAWTPVLADAGYIDGSLTGNAGNNSFAVRFNFSVPNADLAAITTDNFLQIALITTDGILRAAAMFNFCAGGVNLFQRNGDNAGYNTFWLNAKFGGNLIALAAYHNIAGANVTVGETAMTASAAPAGGLIPAWNGAGSIIGSIIRAQKFI